MEISKLIDEVVALAMGQLDILLIVAIVLIVQGAKKLFPKFPKKAWWVVMIAMGFLAAWLVVPVVRGHGKEFVKKGLMYAAFSEFIYQSWRTVGDVVKARIAPQKKKP